MNQQLETVARQSLELIENTAVYIRTERARWSLSDLKFKKDTSLVTSIDVAVENKLVEGLGKILPGSRFLAEEKHSQLPDAELVWVIDPIDGTTNFVHNFPMYCMSVALMQAGRLVLGIIYEISGGECFYAWDGQEGAFLNKERIYVSEVPTMQQSILATGFPSGAFSRLDEYMQKFRHLMTNTQGLRRLGSAAMDLAYVACGRCDGFFEYELNPWDVAAGAYLVQKAGGKVTDFSGKGNFLFGREILASNGHIHQEFNRLF